MNMPVLSVQQYRRLAGFCYHISQKMPEVYEEQWLPYMASFPQHWPRHIYEERDLPSAQAFHNLLPFAYFSVRLDRSSWDSAARESAQWWAQVGGLRLQDAVLGAKLLDRSPRCPHLRDLAFACSHFTNGTADALTAWLDETPLVSLSLERCTFKGSGFQRFCAAGAIDKPETLIIKFSQGLREDDFDALFSLPLESLKELRLGHCPFPDWVLEPLFQCQGLRSLEVLALGRTRLTLDHARRFTRAKHLQSLCSILIKPTFLFTDVIEFFATSDELHPDIRTHYEELRAAAIGSIEDAVIRGEPLVDIIVRFHEGVEMMDAMQQFDALGRDIEITGNNYYNDSHLCIGCATRNGILRVFGLPLYRVLLENSEVTYMWDKTERLPVPESLRSLVKEIGMTQPGNSDDGQFYNYE